jgi:hypothetical protein
MKEGTEAPPNHNFLFKTASGVLNIRFKKARQK